MAGEIKKEIELEIAHVLFIDIVGYSKLVVSNDACLSSSIRLSAGPSNFVKPKRLIV